MKIGITQFQHFDVDVSEREYLLGDVLITTGELNPVHEIDSKTRFSSCWLPRPRARTLDTENRGHFSVQLSFH